MHCAARGRGRGQGRGRGRKKRKTYLAQNFGGKRPREGDEFAAGDVAAAAAAATTAAVEDAAAAVPAPDAPPSSPKLSCCAVIGRRQSLTPNGGPQPRSYAHISKEKWDHKWLQIMVREAEQFLLDQAKTDVRLKQLIVELFTRPFCRDILAEFGIVDDRAARTVCNSVKRRLAELRLANVEKDSIGRLVYTGVIAACLDHAFSDFATTRQEVADTIGVSRWATYRAEARKEKVKKLHGDICLLDPTRNPRKDRCSVETVAAVEAEWARLTKAAPDKKPFVKLILDDGSEVCHGIHWQQKSTRELYLKYLDDPPVGRNVRTVGLTTFTALKPYFVRKIGFKGCLCGKCHHMRKLTEGLCRLLTDAAGSSNTCTCSFCRYHRDRAKAHVADPKRDAFETRPYPPESPDALTAELFCPKPALRPNSGFGGTHYPTHSICCLANHLTGSEQKFVNGEGTAPANLPAPPVKCQQCADKFPLRPPETCEFAKTGNVTYSRFIDVPRRSGNSGQEKTREESAETTVSRQEFLAEFERHLSLYLLHKYVADWQDAIVSRQMETERSNHCVIGQDFGMNYTCIAGEELKGGFFEREQVSLHTIIVYSDWPDDWERKSHPDGRDRAKKMMQTVVYFSDDKHHDATYVKHNHDHLYKYLHAQREKLGMRPLCSACIVSDGGPGHYKQGRNFYNMSLMKESAAPREYVPGGFGVHYPDYKAARLPFVLIYEFLAPDHGKGQWDGVTSSKKIKLMHAEQSGLYEALSSADRIVKFLERPEWIRQKDPGHPKAPFPVRSASQFSAEYARNFLTPTAELERLRAMEGEATTVAGTRSHFSYVFDRPGSLRMRWLGCPCVGCSGQTFDSCVQPDMCGRHTHENVAVSETRGVRAHDAHRRLLTKDLCEKVAAGDIVAVLAAQDRRKFWLGQCVAKPRGVTDEEGQRECPHTGDIFRARRGDRSAERFLELKYLRNPTDAEEDDLHYIVEHQHDHAAGEAQPLLQGEGLIERRGRPFLVATGLLRGVVCDAATWASWEVQRTSSDDDSDDADDDVPLAAARFRKRWALPQSKRDAVVSTIDNDFKDGLYCDDANVPEGRLRGESPADRPQQQQATEQRASSSSSSASTRAGRRLGV